VSVRVTGEIDDVHAGVEVNAYRIVQEALTNVRRHAGMVRKVEVSVVRENGSLTVEVDDDGAAGGRAPCHRGVRHRGHARTGGRVRWPAAHRPSRRWRLAGAGSVPRGRGARMIRPNPIRTVLVDDQAMVRAGFRMILEANPISPSSVRPPTG
jgi:hypothetical protein